MKIFSQYIVSLLTGTLFCLVLASCGSSPWRYNPDAPEIPAGLTATAGDGQVALSWSAAGNAAAYDVYYAPSSGVSKSSGVKIANVHSTSTIVTGLTNGVTYYFAVAAVNASTDSPLSSEASATPSPSTPFLQSDLQGTWYFNALVSGTNAGWLRGIAAIDGSGNVSVTSFLDSSGKTTAPLDFFSVMTIQPEGTVTQSGAAATFHGVLSAGQYRDLLVGTGLRGGTSPLILVMQKRVPGISYDVNDIKGTGRLVAGPLPFVYHQLSSGTSGEWEYAAGQIGQDQSESYASINGPTPRQLPGGGNKVASAAITADGIVSERPLAGALPQPAVLLAWGVMSADKMTVVGTATDTNGAYLLRIIQFVHPPSIVLTPANYTLAQLAGTYAFHTLAGLPSPLWAYGSLGIDGSGTASAASYLDSGGSTALPDPVALSMDPEGTVTNSAVPSYHGKLSYFGELLVATRTESSGAYSLSLALKR
jgi:Fibronectin type III domain